MRVPAFAACALLSINALGDPRTDVSGIAAVIEANYFEANRAITIADQLRSDAAAGAFDRYVDRRDLANELSARLRKLDGHFSVSPDLPRPPQQGPRSRAATLSESRTNYGFTRVERLPGNIAYMEVTYAADLDFSSSDAPARRAADAALAMLSGADAAIIDLRRNGGGAPSMVGYLVSAFIESEANVYNTFHSREGTQSERPAVTYPAPMLTVPLYVLTSGRTGSAAESIAFTLQTAKRAQVVGEASGGAANPGRPFPTRQGYTVFVSTGSPRNPINGRNWEGVGVQPNVAIDSERALSRARELALEKILTSAIAGAARTDALWALEALRAPANSPTALADAQGDFGAYALESSGGVLRAKRARWPAMTLRPLQKDVFYFEDNPSRRVALEREGGKVVAITILSSDGNEQRLQRIE